MKVYVAGHKGLVGSEVIGQLKLSGHEPVVATRNQLDLRNRKAVMDFFHSSKPDAVILAAAVVGGIKANMERPVEFLSHNLQIQTNVIDAAHEADVEKLIFLGSSCIYPKFSEQPIRESSLLAGPLEPTNKAYAIAKIAGVELVNSYAKQFGRKWLSVMPTNVYGPRDNFNDDDSHVLPALIRKIRNAIENDLNEVELWGTGNPRREFIHSKDLASALCLILESMPLDLKLINVGTGEELTIFELAKIVASALGFEGQIVFNTSMPDGTPRKVLDSSSLRSLGWTPKIRLEEGIYALTEAE